MGQPTMAKGVSIGYPHPMTDGVKIREDGTGRAQHPKSPGGFVQPQGYPQRTSDNQVGKRARHLTGQPDGTEITFLPAYRQ